MITFHRIHEGRRLRYLELMVGVGRRDRRRFAHIKLWTIPSYWKVRFWVLGPVSIEWGS